MAIRVHHNVPLGFAGAAVGQIGQNQAIGQGAELDQRRAEFLLGLGQRDRALDQQAKEFAVNTALRVDQQDREQQRWATQLAITDATQQRQAYEKDQDRQYDLFQQQIQGEQQLAQQQEQEQFRYLAEGAKTVDQQVDEQLQGFRGQKLTPEGQRILNEYSAKRRQIQSEPLLPAARQQAMGKLAADMEQSNLPSYVVQEPSAEEKVFSGMVPLQGQKIVPGQPLPPGKYRSLKGVRNGVEQFETIDIPPAEEPTTAQRIERDSVPAIDGGQLIWIPEKQTYLHIPPAKSEKSESEKAEPVMSQRDKAAATKIINDELQQEWQSDWTDIDGNPKNGPDGKPMTFVRYKREHEAEAIERYNRRFGDPDESTLVPSELHRGASPQGATLSPQFDSASTPTPFDAISAEPDVLGDVGPEAVQELGGDPSEPELAPGESIITNPAGKRGILHADGTVTPLD